MKKILLAFIILSLTLVGCEKNVEQPQNPTNNTGTQTTTNDNKDNTTDEKKGENTNQENKDNKPKDDNKVSEKREAFFINFADSYLVFDDSITNKAVEDFVKSNNVKLEDNTLSAITIQDNNITEVKKADKANISGVYTGLIDSNTAEFGYNNIPFVLRIDEKQMEILEQFEPNTLLHLSVESNENGLYLKEILK